MSDVDTSADAVERLATRLGWRIEPEASATLRALLAERDALKAKADDALHRRDEKARGLADVAAERDAAQAEVARLQEALRPFARVWRVNAALQPEDCAPLAVYIAGRWPTMGDVKRAYEVLAKEQTDG